MRVALCSAMCENFLARMPLSGKRDRTLPKVLFIAVLGVIVATIVYAAVQKSQWSWPVPESAKLLQNPLHADAVALESARRVYADKCADCHGDTGKGDGRKASTIDPTPFDFTDAARMNTITDGELFYKLSEGKKPMPVFKTRLSEEQRWGLVLLIRSFAAPSSASTGQKAPTEARPADSASPSSAHAVEKR
jgi:mono/diheme cytochrome c family protein